MKERWIVKCGQGFEEGNFGTFSQALESARSQQAECHNNPDYVQPQLPMTIEKILVIPVATIYPDGAWENI